MSAVKIKLQTVALSSLRCRFWANYDEQGFARIVDAVLDKKIYLTSGNEIGKIDGIDILKDGNKIGFKQ